MFGEDFIQRAITGLPVLIFSLTVHEYFHAWTAMRFGDTTARDQGRLTLNPLAHLDMMGTLMMVLSQFRFGWAKPVPVNPYNLKGNVRVADFWISAAGPLSNIGIALAAGVLYHLFVKNGVMPQPFDQIVINGIVINAALAFFNLIPLFPLDGSHILKSILPESMEDSLNSFERISPFVLLALIIFGGVWLIIGPPVIFFSRLVMGHF